MQLTPTGSKPYCRLCTYNFIENKNPVLINNRRSPASERYRREGGAPFHLLQERKCRLVIQIKLTNHDNQKMCHFVSWDGHTVHDSPYNSKVNDIFDRASKKGSDNVVKKMNRRDFKNWQITNVYDLLDLNP